MSTASTQSPFVDVDLFSDDLRQNWRTQVLEWARRDPFYVRIGDVPQVVVARNAQVRELLMDQERFTVTFPPSAPLEGFDMFRGLPRLAKSVGERHRRFRNALQPAFNAAGVARYEAAMSRHIEEILDELEARPGDELEVVEDFARKLVPRVLYGAMLGLDEDQQAVFVRMNAELYRAFAAGQETPEYELAFEDARGVIQSMIAEREARPADDFLGSIVTARMTGADLTDDEIFANVYSILAAGLTLIGNIVTATLLASCQYPDQFAEVHEDPGLMSAAIEESLRCHPAGIFTSARYAVDDTSIGDTWIAKDTPVHPCLSAANLDADVFPDPLRFDIHRDARRHMSFGVGPHNCAGGLFTRRITQLSVEGFLRRFPRCRLADSDYVPVYGGSQLGELQIESLPVLVS